jgi:hypothetical protein
MHLLLDEPLDRPDWSSLFTYSGQATARLRKGGMTLGTVEDREDDQSVDKDTRSKLIRTVIAECLLINPASRPSAQELCQMTSIGVEDSRSSPQAPPPDDDTTILDDTESLMFPRWYSGQHNRAAIPSPFVSLHIQKDLADARLKQAIEYERKKGHDHPIKDIQEGFHINRHIPPPLPQRGIRQVNQIQSNDYQPPTPIHPAAMARAEAIARTKHNDRVARITEAVTTPIVTTHYSFNITVYLPPVAFSFFAQEPRILFLQDIRADMTLQTLKHRIRTQAGLGKDVDLEIGIGNGAAEKEEGDRSNYILSAESRVQYLVEMMDMGWLRNSEVFARKKGS